MRFRFVWKNGSENFADGLSVSEALSSLGFGNGSIPALDYWEMITEATR